MPSLTVRKGDRWKGLSTEKRNPLGRDLDLRTTVEIVRRILTQDRRAVSVALARARGIASLAERAAAAWSGGGRVLYIGAGTSGRLGVLDAAELPPTFGLPFGRAVGIIAGGARALQRSVEGAEDSVTEGTRAVRRARTGAKDFVLGISASSLAPYVRAGLAEARRRGAQTAILTMNPPPGGAGRRIADIVVVIPVGREILRGSTRMKSGTATKVALHTMTTTAMVLLGKVWEGEMVDLRPWCSKLEARARRILSERLGIDSGASDRLFLRAGRDLRVALVMGSLGLSPREARARLAAAQGNLRRVLPARRRR